MENIEKLTELQKSFGYVAGFLNPIAVLGLAGECGEVLAELTPSADLSNLTTEGFCMVHNDYIRASERLDSFVSKAREIDNLKKSVRKNELSADRLSYTPADDEAFDEELSDLLYYLNAVAIGRGLTLNDLARMSHAKVLRKRATVGPEMRDKP